MAFGRIPALLLLAATLAAQTIYPDKDWERAKPEDSGYSSKRLAALSSYLATLDTTAMMVIYRGRVIFEYGDLTRQSYLASVRKSLLAMLYGRYVASGKINLDATLEDLGMDDVGGLLPAEKKAKVRHLITARSGVYHPASYSGDDLGQAPPRGTQLPGAYHTLDEYGFSSALKRSTCSTMRSSAAIPRSIPRRPISGRSCAITASPTSPARCSWDFGSAFSGIAVQLGARRFCPDH